MDNREIEKAIIALCKSAIEETSSRISCAWDFEKAYLFAQEQNLIPLFYYGASNSNIEIPAAYVEKIEAAVLGQVIADQKQQYAVRKVFEVFETAKIDYMPIKGVLLKTLYPQTEMRPMGDADILIRVSQRDAAVKLLEAQGFSFAYETAHEIVFALGEVQIELHKCLIPPRTKDFYTYYQDSWSFAKKIPNTESRYEMSAEDHFVFLITHFAKHYRAGGVGVLHLVDLHLFLQKMPLDQAYVRKELQKLRLLQFYDNLLLTIENWFSDGALTDVVEYITHRIFSNGLWGTEETKDFAIASRTNSSKYWVRQFFPNLESMEYRYPILKKCGFLLPIMWIVRGFDLLLFRRARMQSKIRRLRNISTENVETYQNELHYVGLDFNYKE